MSIEKKDGGGARALNDLAGSILQLRVSDKAEKSSSSSGGTAVGRQAKHSPLVMTPGGSFVKAKGRTANQSPDADDDDDDDEDDEDGEGMTVVLDPIISAKGRAIASSPAAATASPEPRRTPPPAQGSHTVPLFGGAITLRLPASFEDVSLVRQVPDHQEVYVDRYSERSLILEIVQHDKEVPSAQAARHYFTDLAECNEATSAILDSAAVITDASFLPGLEGEKTVVKCALTGRQTVRKFGQPNAPAETVQILMVVVRLPRVGTDLLLSMNVPFSGDHVDVSVDALRAAPAPVPGAGPPSAATDAAAGGGSGGCGGGDGGAGGLEAVFAAAAEPSAGPDAAAVMRGALASLVIRDWSLFA